ASTHARTAAISSLERGPLGGISPPETFSTSRLSAGRPGRITTPLSPPASADDRRLRSRPPFLFPGPWQATHRSATIPPASRRDAAAADPDDEVAFPASGPVCAAPRGDRLKSATIARNVLITEAPALSPPPARRLTIHQWASLRSVLNLPQRKSK